MVSENLLSIKGILYYGVLAIAKKRFSPGQTLLCGYLLLIVAGTILLLIPAASAEGKSTSLLEALFTATSATAVTGLAVVNTAEHWSRFGHTVIMLLMQFGGFGFMTSTTLLFLILRKRFTLKERLMIMEGLNYPKLSGVISLSRYVIFLTFFTELIGTILLFLKFRTQMPAGQAWYFALFHAISAFNNAGFDLFGNSLEEFLLSPYINLVISALFIFGGLGFIVIAELFSKASFKQLSLHTKLVLTITLILTVLGTLTILLVEYNNPATLGQLKFPEKLLASFFQAVTPRTAGFNTIPINHFKDVSLFLMIILMFIGASPGSTGGGVKTTTIGVLLLVVYNTASRKEEINFLGRRIKNKDIFKTLSVVTISLLVIALVILILSLSEDFAFIQIIFEVFSAFGTVGLSTGITAKLSTIGKIVIILTMFIGRVGPFTIALALGKRGAKNIHYPEEEILIG